MFPRVEQLTRCLVDKPATQRDQSSHREFKGLFAQILLRYLETSAPEGSVERVLQLTGETWSVTELTTVSGPIPATSATVLALARRSWSETGNVRTRTACSMRRVATSFMFPSSSQMLAIGPNRLARVIGKFRNFENSALHTDGKGTKLNGSRVFDGHGVAAEGSSRPPRCDMSLVDSDAHHGGPCATRPSMRTVGAALYKAKTVGRDHCVVSPSDRAQSL